MDKDINNTPTCDICQPCCPNVKIDKIEEGMTGKEVADLLYNNFDKLNKSKANKCVERKVRNIIKGENKVFNETAKNAFINKIFYTWSKKDWNTTLQYIKDNLGSAKNVQNLSIDNLTLQITANKINELLDSLREAGLMKQS